MFDCFPISQPNEDRNILEESAGYVAKQDATEPQVGAKVSHLNRI